MTTTNTIAPANGPAPAVADAPRPARSRILWLDNAKGIGIVLIVIGHAIAGMVDARGPTLPAVYPVSLIAMHLFDISVFFLVSGLFVGSRIARNPGKFGWDMIVTIAWPYFLWSSIQLSAIYFAGALVNSPVQSVWRPIMNLPFASTGQFWFLYVLFFMHLFALVLVPRIGALAFLGLAVAAKIADFWLGAPMLVHLMLSHGATYALGVWAGPARVEALLRALGPRGRAAVLAAAVLLVAAFTVRLAGLEGGRLSTLQNADITGLCWRLPNYLPALPGVLALLIMADSARGRLSEVLTYLGQRSMAIFALHILFIAGLRILLLKLHLSDPLFVVAACATLGLAGPLAVVTFVRRFNAGRALGLG